MAGRWIGVAGDAGGGGVAGGWGVVYLGGLAGPLAAGFFRADKERDDGRSGSDSLHED